MSVREAAREFGLHRDTVRKMLQYSIPPRYRRSKPARRPKLEPYVGVIDQLLEEDKVAPKKQRHTVKRIFERLREEHGFTGGYTIVKDYVRERRRRLREMYVPLSHPPGHAQCDFGQAKAVIGGVERKIHYFVLDLPHSDGCFVKAYPAETTEAFCDGHVSAFTFLGGVPRSILYDNTRLVVAKILGDGRRKRTRVCCTRRSASSRWSGISWRRGPVHKPGPAAGDGGPEAPEFAYSAAVCAAGCEPFQSLLPSQGYLGKGPVADEGDGPAVLGDPLLRVEADGGGG